MRGMHPAQLATQIKSWGAELGFQAVGIAGVELPQAEQRLMEWLAAGRHGAMNYMAKHGSKRARPAQLLPGTLRVISARLDYRPPQTRDSWEVMHDPDSAFISRYALGRDYHKLMRQRLQQLADRITQSIGPFQYRVYTDSAPVMEVELAQLAGLGWRGKHTLLLQREHGSWFFLGEIYTDLDLPTDTPSDNHCGTCQACIEICPTRAIIAPYQLDARRCISYLTIELKDSIPEELRPLMGNRIYGCDDCQLVCPWNKFAQTTHEAGFHPRQNLDDARLIDLFAWSDTDFESRLQGSAIRRIGHAQWLRNIAVALGNAPTSSTVIAALQTRHDHPSALVREHVGWALARHGIIG